MVHHLVLFKLKPEVDDAKIEWMMRQTRIQLLKIPEVLNVRCGKPITPNADWTFFLSVDVESMEKLAIYRDDPNHVKFVEEVIRPNTTERMAIDYEMDPAKDVRYS
jgi:Stress responsive A/B Barrel Domain.